MVYDGLYISDKASNFRLDWTSEILYNPKLGIWAGRAP